MPAAKTFVRHNWKAGPQANWGESVVVIAEDGTEADPVTMIFSETVGRAETPVQGTQWRRTGTMQFSDDEFDPATLQADTRFRRVDEGTTWFISGPHNNFNGICSVPVFSIASKTAGSIA